MIRPDGVYASTYAWTEDFWLAFLERPKILRWLCKLIMGRYAWNELVGAKDTIQKYLGRNTLMSIGYCLRDQEYHKEFDKYKDW